MDSRNYWDERWSVSDVKPIERYVADAVRLPRGPVIAISSVKYYDTSSPETLQTWAASNYYLHNEILYRVNGVSYPSVGSRVDNVQITYTAGWLDQASPRADATPEKLARLRPAFREGG